MATEYVILLYRIGGEDGHSDGYMPLSQTFSANSVDAAIRAAALAEEASGVYVAIPRPTWERRRKLTVAKQPAVTFIPPEAE